MNEAARPPSILITIDVEDWFQVENFKSCIPYETWPSCELRVERNTHRLLDLMDSAELVAPDCRARTKADDRDGTTVLCRPRATFFVLAWIAERIPRLVREIQGRGHEIGSHGCTHKPCGAQSTQELWQDLTRSKKILEDIIGGEVAGFRAPCFSINERILERIRDAGYRYDSSYNSFRLHHRYGRLRCGENGNHTEVLSRPVEGLYELPVSNLCLGGRSFPWGGGAYFRLIPAGLFRSGVRSILRGRNAYVMYLHPWEIDPEQPRVRGASPTRRLRHYSNLGKTWPRMKRLVQVFSHCRFPTCGDYIAARNAEIEEVSCHRNPIAKSF